LLGGATVRLRPSRVVTLKSEKLGGTHKAPPVLAHHGVVTLGSAVSEPPLRLVSTLEPLSAVPSKQYSEAGDSGGAEGDPPVRHNDLGLAIAEWWPVVSHDSCSEAS